MKIRSIMKLKAFVVIAVLVPSLGFAQDSLSKKQTVKVPDTSLHAGLKKQIIINAGFAWSSGITYIMELIHGANPDAGFGASGPNSFKVGANYCLGADYGISNRTTVGLALSYVQVTGSYDSLGITEKFSRLNISSRLLYHFTKNCTKKDWYFGIRWGLSFWKDKLPMPDSAGYTLAYEPYFSVGTATVEPSLQILLGWRRYFAYGFGIHAEAGIGTPYFLEGGITIRLRNNKK